jgi:hypothetical protein
MIVEYKVRWSIRVKEHLGLIVIISITLAVGGILIVFNLLPEQQAMKFNPLSETPIKTDFRYLRICLK